MNYCINKSTGVRKSSYSSKHDALRAANRINVKTRGRKDFSVYQCLTCDNWHLTKAGQKAFNKYDSMRDAKEGFLNEEAEYWLKRIS